MTFLTGFDQLSIANMALSLIGARSSISDLNENSAEAAQIRLWYEFSRAQTLQAYDWNFARRRLPLVAYTDIPDYTDYAVRYHPLTDMISMRKIWNPSGPSGNAIPYEMENFNGEKTILTNMEDAVAVFTSDQTDVLQFPPLFVEALAACVAYHIAFTLTGSQEVKAQMAQVFRVIISTAAANDGNEQQAAPPREAEAIRSRA